MKVPRNDMDGIRVKFNGHLRPFKVTVYLCTNLNCPCTQVTLEFTEIEDDGADVSNPIDFRFKLDIETWQKHPDTNFSEPINALIDEFVHDLSDELKTTFTEAYDRKQERRRNFANFTMPTEDIRRGLLVSFSEVMSGTEDYDGFPDYGFKFTTQDHTYYINDLYCPNPNCDCKNVCLFFLKQEKTLDGKTTLTEAFAATLSLKGKNLGFLRLGKYSQSQVAELVNQWLENDPEAIDTFLPRYNEIRKATKRILKTNRNSFKNIKLVRVRSADGFNHKPDLLSAEDTAEKLPPSVFPKKVDSPVGKTGRNDPCPCGSGKKYKKCCFNQK